ncbi:MAG: NAD(+)/NADH kinase [Treponema sp.]|jgi:NAD+ kinase|nr:NAD(+)/NADH kinase [Treponema sp.]
MEKKTASAVLFVNFLKSNSTSAAGEIREELKKINVKTEIFSFDGMRENPLSKQWDIAFSLGGDGTVLSAARCLAPLGVPILPVNLGTLGFIAAVEKEKWLDVFLRWEKGELSLSRRCMLEISVERNSQIIMINHCLNDAVISATGIAKLIKLRLNFTNSDNTALGYYRCDGLIIATPTGSTAYSLAAGGPILDPEMEAVILNPICPFTLSNRPLVLPSRQTLAVTVAEEQRSGVLLTVDGQEIFNLECKDRIIIRQAPWPALLIFADRHGYYSALNSKLSLSGNGNANA